MTDGERVPGVHGRPRLAQLCRGLRIGVQLGLRIRLQQGGQPRGVGVVGMLMGDQDRVQAGDALETVREVPGIEQHRRLAFGAVAEAGQQAGVAEVRELHGSIVACIHVGRVTADQDHIHRS